MIGAPIVVARAIVARYALSWRVVGLGAVTFVASQVGHISFNAAAMPLLSGHGPLHLATVSIFLGVSAGCFEELARFVAMRFVMKTARTGAHALAFGAGHGGVESLIFGGLVARTLVNLLVIERTGVENLGLD